VNSEDKNLQRIIQGAKSGVSARIDEDDKVTVRGQTADGRPLKIVFSARGVDLWSPKENTGKMAWMSMTSGEFTQGALAGALGHDLASWLARNFNLNMDDYDKAIDSVYNSSRAELGSLYHHLTDGNHTFFGAVKAVSSVSPDDGFLREIYEALEHLVRDLCSVTGINPFFYVSPEALDWMASVLRPFGISKLYLADAMTLNAVELLGAIAATLTFGVRGDRMDDNRITELLGSMLTAAVASANPLLLTVFAWQLFRFVKAKQKTSLTHLGYHMGKGALVTGSVALASSALAAVGCPVWINIAGCFAACIAARYGIGTLERVGPRVLEAFRSTAKGMADYLPMLERKAMEAFSAVLAREEL